jgi:hypothetical protein
MRPNPLRIVCSAERSGSLLRTKLPLRFTTTHQYQKLAA